MPGRVVSEDVTRLLELGHWASYNVPFFREVYDASGYPQIAALARRGPAHADAVEGAAQGRGRGGRGLRGAECGTEGVLGGAGQAFRQPRDFCLLHYESSRAVLPAQLPAGALPPTLQPPPPPAGPPGPPAPQARATSWRRARRSSGGTPAACRTWRASRA